MSIKLHDCPYSGKIVCDTGYSINETNRQALETPGQYVKQLFLHTTECRCNPEKCKRYLDKLKQLEQQKTK